MHDAALMDVMTAQFAEELAQVLTLVTGQVRRLVRQLQTDRSGRIVSTQQNLQRAVHLRADLIATLERAGFEDLVTRAVDEPLDELARRLLRGVPQPLTAYDLDALVALKEIRLAELLQVGADIGVQLWRVVVDGVLGVRPVDDLVDDIADMLDVSEKWARQVYDTAVSTFSRQVGQIGTTGEDDELFLYVGPNDAKTRPFCVDLVGEVHTRAEIDAMDNGQLPNVMLTGGGYNCRHQWRRVSPLDRELLARRVDREPDDEDA